MPVGADLFEVVAPAADVAARRLTTAAYVAGTMAAPPSAADLESLIDDVSARAARYCKLATDVVGTPPTFARETLQATWLAARERRGDRLLLPWRVPIVAINSVVEGGVTLSGADFKLLDGAMALRLSSDGHPACWSSDKVVIEFAAGWANILSVTAPIDLQAAIAEQVKYRWMSRDRDSSIRSQSHPDVWSVSYSVPGGDSIGESGLMRPVEEALEAFKRPPIIV